jgi:hypothetical protein
MCVDKAKRSCLVRDGWGGGRVGGQTELVPIIAAAYSEALAFTLLLASGSSIYIAVATTLSVEEQQQYSLHCSSDNIFCIAPATVAELST